MVKNNITRVTKRDIINLVSNTSSVSDGFTGEVYSFCWYGVLTPCEFLNRLYKLEDLPSLDSRFHNAKDDIWQHTITNPGDYSDDWVFTDERFPLQKGNDEDLLRFLCEMFHPEVRDDSVNYHGNFLWKKVWEDLNGLLQPDGYKLVIGGNISGRATITWVNRNEGLLTKAEVRPFELLFNRGGFVLDFSTPDFNEYTKNNIGFSLCDFYSLSKGKSLMRYLEDSRKEDARRFLCSLVNYYENSDFYEKEIVNSSEHVAVYQKCKEIMASWSIPISAVEHYAKELEVKFSSEYMSSQIELMVKMEKDNPTEAIGKAKELIESCCKTILEDRKESFSKTDNCQQLVDKTMKLLRVMPNDISDSIPAAQSMKKVLGNLKSIAQGIAELRNVYGSGHGKPASYKGLEERHAKLAVGSATTLVSFLWDSHTRK